MGAIIEKVLLSKNLVNTNESFTISVKVKETVSEPKGYRFPFKLGRKKGGIK